MGEIVLVRHGETAWSRDGRHTGCTDVALTTDGERQARALGSVLAARSYALVLTSPLLRAARTAELSGLPAARSEPDLREWDYGGYEGLTTPEIRSRLGRPWTVFADGVVPGDTPGETLDQVADRARRVLERVRPYVTTGDVALAGHGHALRVLAACWVEQPPADGAHLELSAGSVSVLGAEHGVPTIASWNLTP